MKAIIYLSSGRELHHGANLKTLGKLLAQGETSSGSECAQELRLVQKVDRNNKNVMWCFAEFSTTDLAARTLKVLQVSPFVFLALCLPTNIKSKPSNTLIMPGLQHHCYTVATSHMQTLVCEERCIRGDISFVVGLEMFSFMLNDQAFNLSNHLKDVVVFQAFFPYPIFGVRRRAMLLTWTTRRVRP